MLGGTTCYACKSNSVDGNSIRVVVLKSCGTLDQGNVGAMRLSGGAYVAKGRWFDSTYSRNVGTLGKSFTRSCLYDVIVSALCGCLAVTVITCYHPFILDL